MNKLIKQAFTLIELLVVIAIIGILFGLIVVSMSGVMQKATMAKAQVFSNSLRNSLMANIVGEWKFDGAITEAVATNANVLDSWGGVNNGDVLLPTAHQPTVKVGSNCVSGSCLSFDGSDDYVDIGESVSLTSLHTFTINVWFKPIVNNEMTLLSFSKGNSFGNNLVELRVEKDMRPFTTSLRWIVYTDAGVIFDVPTAADLISLNQWTQGTITNDGTNFKVYINGSVRAIALTTTGTTPSEYTGLDENLIGMLNRGTPSSGPFKGLMDEVRIYNASIPISQIKEQYYAGLNSLLSNGSISQLEYLERIKNETAQK
ncbi:MAG: LamG-like jellyroll fold domain-containing protein [Candidatus Paceibacterota bacterium]